MLWPLNTGPLMTAGANYGKIPREPRAHPYLGTPAAWELEALTHVSDGSEFQIGVALAGLGNSSRTTQVALRSFS